nr:hypothetical protein BaRGS_032862 [Batillaria attramentaria]
MKQGKKISGFNKAARFSMYLPCKFQALAGQTCGDYKITVSPGNVIDFRGHIFLRTVFMSVTNINPDSPDFEKKWTGRTSIQIAKKYIDGNPKQTQPFNSMFGSVGFGFCDIFTATAETGEKKSFEITEKNGAFSFQYSLIDEDNKKRYKTSGFEFKCYRDVAQEDLKPYPRQICGNGDDSILPQRTSELGFDDDDLTLLFDVLNSTAEQSNFRNKTLGFESEGLFNSSCGRVTNAFERRCDAAERLEAVETCKEILMSNKHIKCLAKDPNTPLPGDVFWKHVVMQRFFTPETLVAELARMGSAYWQAIVFEI